MLLLDSPTLHSSLLAESAVAFSMVRHPFERLASAYQSKFVKVLHNFLSKQSIHLTQPHGPRESCGKVSGENQWTRLLNNKVSFARFAELVLHTHAQNCPRLQDCTVDEAAFR